ncbi:MAG: hypothetical protein ACREBQ_11680 [Nitrososphaerales archaeon]
MAFILAIQAYHAFTYAKKDYLLNFSAGFLLLALSYIVLVPLALGISLPAYLEDADDIVNYPLFAVMQTIGYALIALAYSQRVRGKQILVGLTGLLIVPIILVLSPGAYMPESVDILLYLLNTSLLGFVLYHMLKVMPPTDLVFAGFLLLAIHEYTALIGSINESIYSYPDEGSFFVAELLRLSALCTLFVSFLVVRRQFVPSQIKSSAESA